MCIVPVDSARSARRMLDRDHQSFPARTLRKILRHDWRDLRLLTHRRAGHEAQKNQRNEFDRHSRLLRSLPGIMVISCASALNHIAAEPVVEADGAEAGAIAG